MFFGKNKDKFIKEVDNNPTFIQGFRMGYKEKETYLGMQFSNKGSNDSIMLTLEARRIKCNIEFQVPRNSGVDNSGSTVTCATVEEKTLFSNT